MALTIRFEGRDFTFDKDKINVEEWRELKRKYGMTPKGFDDGIGEADPDASTFLYWLMLRRAGEVHHTLGDHLKPDIIALNSAIAAAESDEPAAEAEPDPTPAGSPPDGSTPPSPGSTTTATSETSATSTSSPSPDSADSQPGTSMS